MLLQWLHQVKMERRFIVSSSVKTRNILATYEVSYRSQIRKDKNNPLFINNN